ncbi:MAG: conjugal transfer protein TraX [Clostridia bacterium]|nr:conjugal transfer protein TraX [Clostridia bacterium]
MKTKLQLSGNQIKLIAIVAMTVDHLTWILFPGYNTAWYAVALHIFGRITAPIMWYFIAEGYHYTRDVKKYAGRLFLLAFISHFAYCLLFRHPLIPFRQSVFDQTSVIWSLAWGLVLLIVYDSKQFKTWQKTVIILLVCAITFCSDWSCIAAVAVLFIGANRGNFKKQMLWLMVWTAVYAAVYMVFLDALYGALQLGTALCIPILCCYNGQRGKWKGMGKFFYVYYPAHLQLIGLLRMFLENRA